MDPNQLELALVAQRNEITEHAIYRQLAEQCRNDANRQVLNRISEQERGHAQFWHSRTGKTVNPDAFRVFRVSLLARLLGLTFVLKQMERQEGTGAKRYAQLADAFPEAEAFAKDEQRHEREILNMLDEEKLRYIGSIVLGLNDALVELTGSLAGFTLALGSTKLITLAGLVTGISAAMSMAASDYLASKAEGDTMAKKSAVYTGVAYIVTVVCLILPYLLCNNRFVALSLTLVTAVAIIFAFNYYLSVAKDLNFRQRFSEMTLISLGVAAFSFGVGYALKALLGVDG
jgi:VIT1/CCC1 family predicted Fe2+/Mn2+ transporter